MNSRLTGYEVMFTRDGNVLQAGARSQSMNNFHDVFNAQGWITRVVVLQTYYPDEDLRKGIGSTQICVTCDVRTYGRYSRVLPKVPVLQQTHGVHDQDVYIPRPSRINLSGGDLVSNPTATQGPTSAENLDGDHVLVGFLDNDPMQPVILPFGMPHPGTKERLKSSAGRVRRIRHNGTVVEWDGLGNITIDAREAALDSLGFEGAELTAHGLGGQIKLVTSDGTRQTSVHLNARGQILLGSDPDGIPADEPLVLGNQWINVMAELLDALSALTVGTGVGPSSPPINAAQFVALKVMIQARLHVSDFVFTKKAH